MALLLGASPAPDGSGEALGTSDALGYALAGFGSSAVALPHRAATWCTEGAS